MFKNKECVGHMVGGAIVGVAVGMLMQKILSPRSEEEQPVDTTAHPKFSYESAKKHPCNNLRVPSHHHKNRRHHRHPRSKSASCSKHVENERGYSSVSSSPQHRSKLSASETDLRSSSAGSRNYKSRNSEASAESVEIDAMNGEYFFNTSTEHQIIELKVPKYPFDKFEKTRNSISRYETSTNISNEAVASGLTEKSEDTESTDLISKTEDRKVDVALSEKLDFSVDAAESYRKSLESMSTEYLLLPNLKNICNNSKSQLLSEINDCTSSSFDNPSDNETLNCSINATCDTLDKELSSDSVSEDRRSSIGEQLPEGYDNRANVTLPMFLDSINLASTENIDY